VNDWDIYITTFVGAMVLGVVLGLVVAPCDCSISSAHGCEAMCAPDEYRYTGGGFTKDATCECITHPEGWEWRKEP